MRVSGQKNLYGYTIGILVIEGYFPRLPGAIGNATSFPFPVLHKVVKGATGERVARKVGEDIITLFIQGARDLEAEGVRAITSSCGFTAMFQRELVEAVNIPVFASSLLLVPLISRMLKIKQRVGIVTADARFLTKRHFDGVGIDSDKVIIAGMKEVMSLKRSSIMTNMKWT